MASPTILVADDDQALVHLLQENLALEGYQIIAAYDGTAAIDLAMERRPDLIILDINMPYSNGFDVLTHLRKTPETESIPVIFMTGIQSKTLYPVIDRHQRVAYVKKPFDLDHLNSVVKQYLAQYPVPKTKSSTEAPKSTKLFVPLPEIQRLD